jgi:hypothetical protein
MKNYLGFIQVDRRSAIRAFEKGLALIGVQFAAALGAGNMSNRQAAFHAEIIAEKIP